LVTLAPASKLDPAVGANIVTLHDFNGFCGFGQTPFGWTPVASSVSPKSPKVKPDDDPTVMDVSWRWDGEVIVGPFVFGVFEAFSTSGLPGLDDYTGQTVKHTPGQASHNTPQWSIGTVETPASVPEPAIGWIAGPALLALAVGRRCRSASLGG
jgi:hypothetical protein